MAGVLFARRGMAAALRILLLADADRETTWLERTLAAGHCPATVARVADEEGCRARLGEDAWDLVIAAMVEGQAPATLRALRDRIAGQAPPLVLLADRFEDVAEAAQRLGATVCLRGSGFAHLGPTLERAALERSQRAARAE